MRRFTAAELAAYLKNHDPLLLDVREVWEYRRCRIAGSRLAPVGDIPRLLPELPVERDIVVICHHGNRSMRVCEYLQQRDFTRLINLDGGIDAWARTVDPTMPTY